MPKARFVLIIKPSCRAIFGAEIMSKWDAFRQVNFSRISSPCSHGCIIAEVLQYIERPDFGHWPLTPQRRHTAFRTICSLQRGQHQTVILRQDASKLDRRYSAGSSFQAGGRRRYPNGMLLHGAFKKQWVGVSGASFGWSKLGGSNFFVGA